MRTTGEQRADEGEDLQVTGMTWMWTTLHTSGVIYTPSVHCPHVICMSSLARFHPHKKFSAKKHSCYTAKNQVILQEINEKLGGSRATSLIMLILGLYQLVATKFIFTLFF